jgi:hypothetical protein
MAALPSSPNTRTGAQDAAVQEFGFSQKFLSTHAAVQKSFNVQRHLTSRRTLRILRDEAIQTRCAATAP